MNEQQAEKIISLLEQIVSNTDDTRRAVSSLSHANSLDDLYTKLDEVKQAIEVLSLG